MDAPKIRAQMKAKPVPSKDLALLLITPPNVEAFRQLSLIKTVHLQIQVMGLLLIKLSQFRTFPSQFSTCPK